VGPPPAIPGTSEEARFAIWDMASWAFDRIGKSAWD